jgi:signal transduction histidine kinase/DNA-binding response OmpR family regulator
VVSLIALPIHSLEGIGRLVIVSGPFTPAIGNDEINRVHQFMTSVTAGVDRRRLVKELKDANRELKEASEHKSVFLANMSHELRTPLNAIIGFSELMLDAKESQFDGPTQKRFLSQVHSSGKHLLGLINDILDLAKVEAGQMELRLQEVAVEPVIAQVVELVEPLAGQKQITIKTEAASAGAVLADAGKLKQMLLNLVSNAIKFTPEGGLVKITARRLPSAVEVGVADTGIGISEADQAKIFLEFHQVDPGPGRRQQGTGLGLALTRRFALLHGGDVRVSSKVGEGSEFTLRLPLQVAAVAPADEKVDGLAADLSRPLVLIVEDDVAAAELLTRQLQAAGFRTHVARTGTEAIAKARAMHPAAITLDILLPEMDGWEVITRLKREEETSSIPVVVVSVVDNPELGKALGALDYFVKPVDGKLLVERLKRFKLRTGVEGVATSVMVVDDEVANRHWLMRILEPAGFEVIEASGGREAIELAKAKPPDLILLDLMMPEVTGFDVVESLRDGQEAPEWPRVHDPESRIAGSGRSAGPASAGRRQGQRQAGRYSVTGGSLVLLVEDNETNQILARAVLERDGYRVLVAGSSEEARRHLETETPSLILMDIQLPGQDGLAFTRQLKRNPATSPIPVVAMTAHVMQGDAEMAIQAGCSGYIAKPIDTRTLAEQVRRFLAVPL